jgi:hypothetical protein
LIDLSSANTRSSRSWISWVVADEAVGDKRRHHRHEADTGEHDHDR